MTEIHNFIASYPSPSDEDLIINLSHFKEYVDLQLQASEDIPENIGDPLQHQELEARYFSVNTPYNAGVLFQEVGTGKTCVASLIIERFKGTIVDGKPRKPALVIVRNSALADSLRNEIANVCTHDVYLSTYQPNKEDDEEEVISLTDEAKRRRLNAAIAKTYEIVKYGDLLDVKTGKKKGGMPPDEEIIRKYSDRVIIVDEIQNIRQQPGTLEKKEKTEDIEKEIEEDIEKVIEESESPKKKHRGRYENLHKFLHLVKNCRILLLTGTPIWDKVYDIAGLFNLILPLNDQFPTLNKFTKEYFDPDNLIKPKKAKEFTRRIRGKVSYIRALLSTAKRDEIGVIEPWLKHTIIYPCGMEKEQSASVTEAMRKFKDDSIGSFYSDARDAANGVYPVINKNGDVSGGVYGVKAFINIAITTHERKITKKSKKTGATKEELKITQTFAFNDKRIRELLGPAKGKGGGARPSHLCEGHESTCDVDIFANLRRFNTKLASIIEMMRDPQRLGEKVFIFNDSVKGTGGVISTALILELWGFRWIKENFKGIVAKENTVERPGNFITVTSEQGTINEQAQIREAIKYFNNFDNRYGTHIRIIIGSETISQGHTLKAIRQAHGIHGHWNLAFIDQSFGRSFRTGSHNQLPEEERYIKIYRHVVVESVDSKTKNSVTLREGVSYPDEGTFSKSETIDTYIYSVAESKEFMNSQIYRLMKKAAWDCSLAYKRNVLTSDKNNSRECDYVECNYLCDGYDKKDVDITTGEKFLYNKGNVWEYSVRNINDSNYNLLYSSKDIKDYVSNIVELFGNYFALRYELIGQLIPYNPPVKFILIRALSEIINKRIPIKNRYGKTSYLNEMNNIYYLDDYITEKPDYLSSVYTVYPLVNEFSTLEDVVEGFQLSEDKKYVCEFVKNPTALTFNRLSHRTKIVLLEASIQEGEKNSVTNFVIDNLSKEIYELSNGEIVHNMYNSEYSGIGYNVASRTLDRNGRLRVFNQKTRKWSYVSPLVEEDYLAQIKEKTGKKAPEPIGENPYKIYGSSDSNSQKFKIHDDRKGKARAGRVCIEGGCKITYLYDVFHHLGHLPFEDEVGKTEKLSKKRLIEALRETKNFNESPYSGEVDEMSTEQLQKLYVLFGMNKQDLCNSLERFLRGENPKELNLFVET
jgi:hypothetical protein